jgi:hypothetical protein
LAYLLFIILYISIYVHSWNVFYRPELSLLTNVPKYHGWITVFPIRF